jgi:uncharacterized protein HemY
LITTLGTAGSSWSDLEPQLREAVATNPNEPRLSFWLGESLREQTRYGEAEELLDRLRAHQPLSPLSYLGMANLAESRKDSDVVRHSWAHEASTRASAANTWGTEVARIAGHLLTSSHPHEAEALLERVPLKGDPWATLYLGVLLKRRDDFRAMELLEEARRRWADDPDFHRVLEECREAARADDS